MFPLVFFFLRALFFFKSIYLAASGLSCGTRDLRWGMWDLSLQCMGSSLRHTGSLVAACRLS